MKTASMTKVIFLALCIFFTLQVQAKRADFFELSDNEVKDIYGFLYVANIFDKRFRTQKPELRKVKKTALQNNCLSYFPYTFTEHYFKLDFGTAKYIKEYGDQFIRMNNYLDLLTMDLKELAPNQLKRKQARAKLLQEFKFSWDKYPLLSVSEMTKQHYNFAYLENEYRKLKESICLQADANIEKQLKAKIYKS